MCTTLNNGTSIFFERLVSSGFVRSDQDPLLKKQKEDGNFDCDKWELRSQVSRLIVGNRFELNKLMPNSCLLIFGWLEYGIFFLVENLFLLLRCNIWLNSSETGHISVQYMECI